MKLFAGLGNPGAKYQRNRHNIGFMAVDRMADLYGFSPWRKKFQGLISEGTIGAERVMLLKPETFMNDSGRAVGEAMRFLKIDPDDVYVFHDELDLAPGKVKVKTGGGNAGHNGLRSIEAHIGNAFRRVRIGIGHPGSKDAVIHYVLNDFAKAEHDGLGELLDAIAKAVPHLAKGDEARFLNDIALGGGGDPEPKRKPKSAGAQPEAPEKPAAKKSAAPHPAGERAQKRQSALAENLKNWLAKRKPDG
jgi:peptidyl-tRNA hydrolase, PTH1 family